MNTIKLLVTQSEIMSLRFYFLAQKAAKELYPDSKIKRNTNKKYYLIELELEHYTSKKHTKEKNVLLNIYIKINSYLNLDKII